MSKTLTRTTSEPHPSKSKLSKSQKEDKELEELTAFFSRRRPHGNPETKEYGFVDRGNHVRDGGHGAESHSSSRGSQRSSRSIAEAAHRYSSSLPAIHNHSSGLGHSIRPQPPNRPKTGSAWSLHNEDQLGGGESEPYDSGIARSRHSATAVINDAPKRHQRSQPVPAAAETDRSSPERRWGVRRGACKDAGAQTDLTPKAGNRLVEQLQRLDKTCTARTLPVEDGKQHGIAEELVRDVSQFSGGRDVEDRPARGIPRYAPHDVPDVGHRPSEEIQSYGRGWDLLDRGESFGERAGALLRWDSQDPAAESINRAGRHQDHYQVNNPGSIPGYGGSENLEEFIRRIEEEAAMPYGEVEDAWVLPEGEFGALGCPRSHPLDFDGEGDAAFVSNRDLFSSRGGLLAPDVVPQEAGFTCSTSLSMPEPDALEDQKAGLSVAPVWLERGMF